MTDVISVVPPYPYFQDVDGNPLENGYIYIGEAGQNPLTNPIDVFSDSDLSIPVAQPVRSLGGYPVRSGSPTRLYTEGGDYSILVRNKNGTLIYSSLHNKPRLGVIDTTELTYDITQAEVNAGVTPVQYEYEPGRPERQGAGLGPDDGPAMAETITANAFGNPVVKLENDATYTIDAWTPLTPSEPVRIVGYGATIEKANGPDVFMRPSTEVYIEGMAFKDFSSILARDVATESGNVEHLLVRNIRTDGLTSSGIFFSIPISKYRIEGCDFKNHTLGYPVVIGRNIAAEQDTWEKGWVIGNSFTDIDAAGDLNGILLYGRDKLILGNFLENLTTSAAGELAGIYTKARYNSIAFNVLRGVTGFGATSQGINVKGSGKLQTSTPQGYATRVIGNHVEGVTGTGGTTGGYGLRLQIDESLAIGNTVLDPGKGSGYVVDADFAGSNVIMADNIGRAETDDATGVGVRVTAFTDRVAIRGMTLENFHLGIRLASLDNSVRTWVVTDNIIKPGAQANNSGVVVRQEFDISHIEISRNHVEAGAAIGIRFESGVAALSDVRVLDNNFNGVTTPFSGTLPKDLQLRHCMKAQTVGASTATALALALSDNSAYMIELRAVGKQSDASNRAMYQKQALIYRAGGSATLQGTVQSLMSDVESNSNWDATIGVSGNSALIQLTGDTGATVDWKLEVNIIAV